MSRSLVHQRELFEELGPKHAPAGELVVLYALGEFQSRGKVLIGRALPLDRLRGAFHRAAQKFGLPDLNDKDSVAALCALGARIQQLPAFVAKHPFRVTVSEALAQRASSAYQKEIGEPESESHVAEGKRGSGETSI